MAKKHLVYKDRDGNPLPSVTTILQVLNKPKLTDWKLAVGKSRAESTVKAAAEFGTVVHSAIQSIVEDGQVPTFQDQRVSTTIENLMKWINNNVEEWVCMEMAVYHHDLKYAGTFDGIVKLKSGKYALIDFKTSKSIHPDYYLQMCAYANAQDVEDDVFDLRNLDCGILVHLNHSTLMWEAVVVDVWDSQLKAVWLTLTQMYPWWKKHYDS